MVCGSPGLSGRRCLSIIRVAYTWNPTVSRGSTFIILIPVRYDYLILFFNERNYRNHSYMFHHYRKRYITHISKWRSTSFIRTAISGHRKQLFMINITISLFRYFWEVYLYFLQFVTSDNLNHFYKSTYQMPVNIF